MDNLLVSENQDTVTFDYETCHLNLSLDNKPWQLSFLIAKGNKALETKNYYIWWDNLVLSEDARRITRFNDNVYKEKAIDPKIVLEEFESYLYNDKYLKVGHNIYSFDIYIHNQFRALLGKKPDYSYLDNSLDTNSLAKMYKLGIQSLKKENIREEMFRFSNFRQKGLKTSLSTMAKEFGINTDENRLHDSGYDVFINLLVWNKLKYLVKVE